MGLREFITFVYCENICHTFHNDIKIIQIASKLVSETYAKVPQRFFFRKSARHLDFWKLGFSILLQKSVVYRPITSKEDSKGRRMDMAMIFSSSKR